MCNTCVCVCNSTVIVCVCVCDSYSLTISSDSYNIYFHLYQAIIVLLYHSLKPLAIKTSHINFLQMIVYWLQSACTTKILFRMNTSSSSLLFYVRLFQDITSQTLPTFFLTASRGRRGGAHLRTQCVVQIKSWQIKHFQSELCSCIIHIMCLCQTGKTTNK